ncbi:PspC domain-containing protein [Kitasatospora sp. NPDC059571]|uniref:PspC domain-containing protein n=1 Tax=Kitasatospora sp. NPDC059571 TaxID=3346871 RepID=UPI0036C88092
MTDEQSTAAAAAAPNEPPRPPLSRSDEHRVVAGVCGGLGRHLDIDPVVFRVVVAVLCLSGGLGLFLYGLAWLIVPRPPEADGSPGRTELQRVLTGRVDGQSIGAVLLTVIGTGVFFSSMGDGGQLFPLLLLGGLVFLAVRYDPERRRSRGTAAPKEPAGPYDRLEEPVERLDWKTWQQRFGADFQAEWQSRKAEMHARLREARETVAEQHARARAAGTVPADTPAPGPSGYLWDPRHPERNPYGGQTPPPGVPAQAWWQRTDLPEGDPLRKPSGAAPVPEPPARPAPPVVHERGRGSLGAAGMLLAVGAGALAWWVADHRGGPVHLATVLAAALLALGLVILVGARYGRVGGLTVPALVLTLALAASGGSDTSLSGGFGDRTWTPVSAAALQDHYDLAAGDATLDLTGLDPAGASLSSSVRVGAGDLKVVLPRDAEVRLSVRSGVGDVLLPNGERLSGTGNSREAVVRPAGGAASRGTVDLTLSVGLGDIKVVQA